MWFMSAPFVFLSFLMFNFFNEKRFVMEDERMWGGGKGTKKGAAVERRSEDAGMAFLSSLLLKQLHIFSRNRCWESG